jgi:hypothetical protein
VDWINLAQDRDRWRTLMNTVMNLLVPYNVMKLFSRCTTSGFSKRARLHGVSYLEI